MSHPLSLFRHSLWLQQERQSSKPSPRPAPPSYSRYANTVSSLYSCLALLLESESALNTLLSTECALFLCLLLPVMSSLSCRDFGPPLCYLTSAFPPFFTDIGPLCLMKFHFFVTCVILFLSA